MRDRDPADMRFKETNEWAHREGSTVVVGISDYLALKLSDVTHVELPEPAEDHHYEAGEELGMIESLQGAAEFHAPVAGRVVAVNSELLVKPELVSHAPFGDGWILKFKPDRMADIDDLMDFDEYDAHLPEDTEEE